MIVGVGIDMVELARIQRAIIRFGSRFTQKVLHPDEYSLAVACLDTSLSSVRAIAYIAARFAAKEACVKAMGTGFSSGVGLHDIRVSTDARGKPAITAYDQAYTIMDSLGITDIHLSLTHEKTIAGAVVILEK